MSATIRFHETHTVLIPAAGVPLPGDLTIPERAVSLVVFVHGSGSNRASTRNRKVASALNDAGFATLLFDLLTSEEDALDATTGSRRFDIALLTKRLLAVTEWLTTQDETRALRIGYFGASTGAAAALRAAAEKPDVVSAVVSRGGRPDLAGDLLGRVRTPTLLIVGGNDAEVLSLNRGAMRLMVSAPRELAVVPRATHLFEEPGTLETVVQYARTWFTRHLGVPQPTPAPDPLDEVC